LSFLYFCRVVILRCCIYFLVLSLLASCASQIPPTGGPKDTTPPTVTKESPKNLSTHFHSKRISITFNEFIQLNDATSQIFFSPALVGKPTYRLHGKTLVITLPDSLRANTTYTVNLGSAVKDITEGNPILDYQYVFGTGAAIDSFRIAGKVSNALDGKTKANVLVMLYRDADDSAVAKRRPDYNARTDSSGFFILNHLAEGNYKLFALDDQDFNMMYNQPGETVAFFDSNIFIHDTIGYYKLSMFRQQAEKQSVLSAYSRQQGKAVIAFAKRTQHLLVDPLEKSLNVITEINASRDTAICWVNDVQSDSIAFVLHDDQFDDTVKVRMRVVETKKKISVSKLSVAASSESSKGIAQLRMGEPLLLNFSSPVLEVNEQRKIVLRQDSSKKETFLTSTIFLDSVTGGKRVMINYPFKPEIKYFLLIPDSSFKDLFGTYNDTTKIHVQIFDEEDLGSLIIHLSFADSLSATPFYYELRDQNGTLISKKTIRARGNTLKFESLTPMSYSLRLIEDRNNNFEWDSGNYWEHLQPEKIFIYNGVITIRANWDVDVIMKIDNK